MSNAITPPEYGDPALPKRFWQKVRETDTGCWEWTASTFDGYGAYWINGGTRRAHRVAYAALVRDTEADLDHLCHNPACCNPLHLRPTTPRLNGENRSGTPRNNSTGVRGVYWNKESRKYQAQVRSNGKRYHAGMFTDLAEAESAVVALRNRLHTNNLLDRAG